MSRPTPFDLVFERAAADRFPALRTALEGSAGDPRDRDVFLMIREAVQLVRDMRPEEGVGEAIDQLVALVHHAYLFWAAGTPVLEIPLAFLPEVLGEAGGNGRGPATPPPAAYYAQLPERRIWAEVLESNPHEPLDGCFVHETPSGELRVLGVFGVHPDRQGFSVVEAIGPRAEALARHDGSALFAPTLTGGKAAGLHSIVGEEELLELGWRTRSTAAGAGTA